MIKSANAMRRILARADQRNTDAFAAQVGAIFPERTWLVFDRTNLLVPYALDKAADKMAVMVIIQASGMNRAFGVAFSLS